MANKSVGFLTIAFGADIRGFDKAMKKAQRSIKKFGTNMQRTGKNLSRNLTLTLIHISEPKRLRRISYAGLCLKKKKKKRRQERDESKEQTKKKTTENKTKERYKQNTKQII